MKHSKPRYANSYAINPYLLRLRATTSGSNNRDAPSRNSYGESIQLIRLGEPPEEQRRDFTIRLRASFNDADSAWETYREHLIEHGILTPGSHSIEGKERD